MEVMYNRIKENVQIKNQIKSFILSLVQQIYTIVFSVGTITLIQINYTERGFQKSRAYHAGLPSE